MTTLRRIIPLIALGALFAVCIDTRPPPASLSVAGMEISGLLVSYCWSSACGGACADGINRTPPPVLGLNVVSVSAWWARGDAYYTFAVDLEQP